MLDKLDWSEPENKKYIPIGTFLLGMFVGGLLMHFYMQKKSKEFSAGGAVQAAPPVVVMAQAPAPAMAAPAPPAMSPPTSFNPM